MTGQWLLGHGLLRPHVQWTVLFCNNPDLGSLKENLLTHLWASWLHSQYQVRSSEDEGMRAACIPCIPVHTPLQTALMPSGFLLFQVLLGCALRVSLHAPFPTLIASGVLSLPLGKFKFFTHFSKQSCWALLQIWPTLLLHQTHHGPTSTRWFIGVSRWLFPEGSQSPLMTP
jgi:hypothetical protein